MGFSIWVADDPELETEEPSHYPHFSATSREMLALRDEMQAQGMFAFIHGSRFMVNDGEHVPARELSDALGVDRSDPVTAGDDEARELWRSWLAFLGAALEHGGIRVY